CTRSSPPQPPGPWMSGIEGAIAISSVSANRQAEGGGDTGAAACSAGLSVGLSIGTGTCLAAAGGSGAMTGACAGRGRGRGTASGRAARRGCDLGLTSPNKLLHGAKLSAPRAAAGLGGAQTDSSAATVPVTIAAPHPKGHLRAAFSALKFMSNP